MRSRRSAARTGCDRFVIVTANDRTGIWWQQLEGANAEQAKEYVDGILRTIKHDCSELGRLNWVDHSN